jgi:hypothetical protein
VGPEDGLGVAVMRLVGLVMVFMGGGENEEAMAAELEN